MKVELYLKNINQEMIDAGRGVKDIGAAEWVVSWPKSCCVIDFSLVRPQDLVTNPQPFGFILRQEGKGGMFWDPKSAAVYRVDEEAYHTMLELDRGFSVREVSRRMKVSGRKVQKLVEQLKRIQRRRKA